VAFQSFVVLVFIWLGDGSRLNKSCLHDLGVPYHHCYRVSSPLLVELISANKTASKILQCGFYWPTMFRDTRAYCISCDHCQKLGSISNRNMMPLNPILVVEIFDVWGIDFMGPFPNSFGYLYILVDMDYVSKWVVVVACKTNDHRVVVKFLKDTIFARFGNSSSNY
jgi:hypothetical protein